MQPFTARDRSGLRLAGARLMNEASHGVSVSNSYRSVRENLPSHAVGVYSMEEAAANQPHFPVLSLNHRHLKDYRAMKFDSRAQNFHSRNMAHTNVKYACPVCGLSHDFKMAHEELYH
eukprot:CAMPEP_0197638126 /NCGR_PEP_ID=MMETSP1338-20131121/13139_1 /TAXON_ID=43686 ORGANISM="Pelagodinium beii, Strain RCC1491" /NCGR_SAMPLE_ID=MMETSP1338 /ASSEMBLY_ACC=CAM_ASM_000754 /LENGTH=117 /DNA_ID=CAMNT_0043210647 /DNA_START=50 /DNA_END=403 /DNA_ORIENTATION=-